MALNKAVVKRLVASTKDDNVAAGKSKVSHINNLPDAENLQF